MGTLGGFLRPEGVGGQRRHGKRKVRGFFFVNERRGLASPFEVYVKISRSHGSSYTFNINYRNWIKYF